MIRVVHANDPLAYEPGAVYIGRRVSRAKNPIAHVDSPYRNPWSIKDAMGHGLTEPEARDYVLTMYNGWARNVSDDPPITDHERRNWIQRHIHQLRDGVLVCWCATVDKPLTATDLLRCHGQVLARIVEL